MARAKYNAQNSHIKLNKKTSQTSRKGRVKMASMNKKQNRYFDDNWYKMEDSADKPEKFD